MCHKKIGKVIQKLAQTEGNLADSKNYLAHLFKCTGVCQIKYECARCKRDLCMVIMENTF
jgi:hypothetical protein